MAEGCEGVKNYPKQRFSHPYLNLVYISANHQSLVKNHKIITRHMERTPEFNTANTSVNLDKLTYKLRRNVF